MIKNFICSIIGVAFLSTVCEMIAPEGKLKKYYKLIMGFVMMAVLLKPLTNISDFPTFEFSVNESITEEELLAAGNAYILKIHEENIRQKILDICGENIEVFIELFTDGRVKSVDIKGKVNSSNIEQLKKELGCENIKVISDE